MIDNYIGTIMSLHYESFIEKTTNCPTAACISLSGTEAQLAAEL